MWRPRPALSLDKKKINEIFLNLGEYRKKYEAEEKREEAKANLVASAKRKERKNEIDSIARNGLLRYLEYSSKLSPAEQKYEFILLERKEEKI